MNHPDKSLNATIFVRAHATKILSAPGAPGLFAALAAGFAAWERSDERRELMREYVRRGFALEDNAQQRKRNAPTTLTASLFELAKRKRG